MYDVTFGFFLKHIYLVLGTNIMRFLFFEYFGIIKANVKREDKNASNISYKYG